jgi:hypothetical protein
VGEAVEQGCGHLCIAKHCGPFTEAEVGGDHDAGAFVKLAQQMEQQRPARCTEGQISQLIKDHEVELGHGLSDLACLALGLFLFEGVDQFDSGEETDLAAVMFDGLDADGRCNVGFTGAWQADDILPAFRDMRFGFGIRFILGLERLCELWRIRSMVVPPI